jgi:membrane protease YdiL (CAAX protease family)
LTVGKKRTAAIVVIFATGLLAVAWLRLQTGSEGAVGALSDYATLIYIGLTVFAAVLLIRAGVPFRRLGFGKPHRPLLYLGLAAAGVGLLQLSGFVFDPLWERLFEADRDLSRFADVSGSLPQLLTVLALSWSVAAFGEELAFRIVLMRSVAFVLGDSRFAFATALVVQAVIFGLVHAYQGPLGIAGTVTSGLIYGGLTLAARGSIWPAALAHGVNNSIGLVTIYAAGLTADATARSFCSYCSITVGIF